MRSLGLGLIVVMASLGVARAEIDMAKSDAAFEEGLKLKDAGKLDAACSKFKEALGYNPNAVGTMLNVAVCDEQTGHIASAYKRFKEARDRGREQNLGEQVKLAEQHIAQLEPDMPYLAIAFAETTDDTKLVVNDEDIPIRDAGGIPVDPGTVSVVVTRPGRVPYEQKLTIEKKEHKAVAVPKLGLPVTVNKGRRRIGQILTIGGGAAVLTGITLGLVARSHYNDAFAKYCMKSPTGGEPTCDATGQPKIESALQLGDFGTGFGIGGAVLAGVGAYLWLFGPHDEKVAFGPHVDGHEAGIFAVGRF